MPEAQVPGSGGLAGFISRAIREGFSQRAAIAAAREAGASFADVRFRALWRAATAAIERRADVMGLPGHRRPGVDVFQPWPTRKGTGFSYQVTVTIRDTATGLVMNQPSLVTYDRRVSVNKAIADARQRAAAGVEGSADYPGLKVEGGYLTGLYEQVPFEQEDVA